MYDDHDNYENDALGVVKGCLWAILRSIPVWVLCAFIIYWSLT